MKRDMDLIRSILIEGENLAPGQQSPIEVAGHSDDEVCEHARLASQANLIEARFHSGSDDFVLIRVTNEGHDFLEQSRLDSKWEEAKTKAKSVAGGVTVDILKAALSQGALHAIKSFMPS